MKRKLMASGSLVFVLLTVFSYIVGLVTKQDFSIAMCAVYALTVTIMYGLAAFGIYSGYKKSKMGAGFAIGLMLLECVLIFVCGNIYLKGMFYPAALTCIFLAYYDELDVK